MGHTHSSKQFSYIFEMLCKIVLGSLVITKAACEVVEPVPMWNYTKCPHAWEVRSPRMVTDSNIEDLPGFYYEIALHDWTQYPICPQSPRCLSSNKTLMHHSDGTPYVN